MAPTTKAPNDVKKAPRGYQKHGLHQLKAAVNVLGARVIDRRSKVGKALDAWRRDLVEDLGGRDAISTQQAALVDLAVRSKLLLDSIDAWLLTQPTLVTRKRALLPAVRERQAVADALARYLVLLGLDRKPPVVDALTQLRTWKPLLEVPAEAVAGPGEAMAKAVEQVPVPQEIALQRGEEAPAVVVVEPETKPAPEPAPRQETKPAERCAYCAGRGRLGKGTLEGPFRPCPWCTPKAPAPEVRQPIVAQPGDAGAYLAAERAKLGRVGIASNPSEFLDADEEIAQRDSEAARIWGVRGPV